MFYNGSGRINSFEHPSHIPIPTIINLNFVKKYYLSYTESFYLICEYLLLVMGGFFKKISHKKNIIIFLGLYIKTYL